MTKKICSECEQGEGGHEFNCAFSTYDARDYEEVAESVWYAVGDDGRRFRFTLAPRADQAFAERYACDTRREAFEFATILSVERA